MSHLDDGLIQELLDGEVPSQELAPIQAHLASCAACSARLEEARDLVSAADEMIGWLDEPAVAAPVVAPDITPRRAVASWPRNVAWAASLMLAVGLGYTARGGPVPAVPVSSAVPVAAPERAALQANDEAPNDAAIRATESAVGATPADRPAATPARSAPTTPTERDAADPGTGNLGQRAAANLGRQASESEAVPPPAALAESRRERADAAPVEDRVAAPALSASGVAAQRLVAREQVAAKASDARVTLDTIGTPAGTLFRIEGLDLLRSTVTDDVVRLVYTHPDGEVTLVQRRVGTQLAWHLEAAAEFPAAVLRELKRRVK